MRPGPLVFNFMQSEPITTKLIDLGEIVIDAGTQIRVAINEQIVTDYADSMSSGDKFPNLVTYFDGNQYILADGFHRYFALKRNNETKVRCEIHKGTSKDATIYALSANGAHGARMTNADKRNAVSKALALFPDEKSTRVIAKLCYVSHNLVADIMAGLSSHDSTQKRKGLKANKTTPNEATRDSVLGSPDREGQNQETSSEQDPPRVHQFTEGGSESTSKPSPAQTNDDKFEAAMGIKAENFYASQIEDIATDAIANATEEQILCAITACKKWAMELKIALARRSL